jgi:hypothetical protein
MRLIALPGVANCRMQKDGESTRGIGHIGPKTSVKLLRPVSVEKHARFIAITKINMASRFHRGHWRENAAHRTKMSSLHPSAQRMRAGDDVPSVRRLFDPGSPIVAGPTSV